MRHEYHNASAYRSSLYIYCIVRLSFWSVSSVKEKSRTTLQNKEKMKQTTVLMRTSIYFISVSQSASGIMLLTYSNANTCYAIQCEKYGAVHWKEIELLGESCDFSVNRTEWLKWYQSERSTRLLWWLWRRWITIMSNVYIVWVLHEMWWESFSCCRVIAEEILVCNLINRKEFMLTIRDQSL